MQSHNNKNHPNKIPINIIKPHTSSQACAACKYQRRKCPPDCLFAPYFPHHLQQKFLNAHRFFGVANIRRIVKDLTPHARDEAMKSIIMHSNTRAIDPVGGIIRQAQIIRRKIIQAEAELDSVNRLLASCKAAASQAPEVPPPKHDILQNWESKLVDDFDAWSNLVNGDDVIVVDDDDTVEANNTVPCLGRKRTLEEESIDAVKSEFMFDFNDDFGISEEMPPFPNENDKFNEDATKLMHEMASSYKSSRFKYY